MRMMITRQPSADAGRPHFSFQTVCFSQTVKEKKKKKRMAFPYVLTHKRGHTIDAELHVKTHLANRGLHTHAR